MKENILDKEFKNDMDIFISNFIPWANEKINESNGRIIPRIEDIKKEMGPKFEYISDRELYWTLKLILYNEGIVTNRGRHKDGGFVVSFRIATPGDTLPMDFSKDEEVVLGIDYIREMEDFNNFDSKKIIYIIEKNKDIIKEVDSLGDNDGVAIYLKSEEDQIDRKILIEGIIDFVNEFCADNVYYHDKDDAILFIWD